MKLNKENRGITLVALIVTIVILLILAGISISSLTGNGLFEKAKLAKEKQNNAELKEETTLADYENQIGQYVDGSRQDITSGSTILWSYESDPNGELQNAGTTDGTSERVFTGYNINNYDAVVVDAGLEHTSGWNHMQSLYINKYDFNNNMMGILSHSSNWSYCYYTVKIDSTNNKIIFNQKGHSNIVILRVIGIKY